MCKNITREYTWGGIIGSYDMCLFNFSAYRQIIFQSGYTNLWSHKQCVGIRIAPHPSLFLKNKKVYLQDDTELCLIDSNFLEEDLMKFFSL